MSPQVPQRFRHPTGDRRLDRELQRIALEQERITARLDALDAGGSAPAVNGNGSSGLVFHPDVANEFVQLEEKSDPAQEDWLLVEDDSTGHIKRRIRLGAASLGGAVTDWKEIDLGAQTTAAGWQQAHGITDWDTEKYSVVWGYMYSDALSIEASAPGVVIVPPIGLIGLTAYVVGSDFYLQPTANTLAFQFSARALIGYNSTG